MSGLFRGLIQKMVKVRFKRKLKQYFPKRPQRRVAEPPALANRNDQAICVILNDEYESGRHGKGIVPYVDVFDARNRAELRHMAGRDNGRIPRCILIREAWRQASEAEFRLADVEVSAARWCC
jgi:hypothetical protein